MNTPYGFKVKFIFDNSFKDDMLITFLKKYMKNFSYLQVSLTNKMLKKNTSSIMKIFQAYCGTNFIYHMKNKRIEDPNFFEELSLFNKVSCDNKFLKNRCPKSIQNFMLSYFG